MTIDYYFGEDEEHYEFEPDYKDLCDTIYQIFADIYKLDIETAETIIVDFGLEDSCFYNYDEELKDHYKGEAYESWQSENEVDNKHNCEV